jgi:transposase
VDLIFWDTTSVYFEVDDEDTEFETKRDTTLPPLRKRGYNKEGRGNQPQVVVGLALTRDGVPVRSWGFPGNTVDATTVAHVKESLRGWKRGRSIFVGDAGMDSEANRQALAQGLGHYILAMPVGKLTEVQEEVLGRPGRFRAGACVLGSQGGRGGRGGAPTALYCVPQRAGSCAAAPAP